MTASTYEDHSHGNQKDGMRPYVMSWHVLQYKRITNNEIKPLWK